MLEMLHDVVSQSSVCVHGLQAVQDKVSENSALLKELWEGQRIVKELQHSLQREKHHSHTLQQEYDLLKHQVCPCLSSHLPNAPLHWHSSPD